MTDTAAAEIEDKITVELVGDIRRDSFIKSSKERAMDKYGLTHGVIFTGSFVDKKFAGHDWTTKKRFIWLDPQKKIFHWSKVSDIKVNFSYHNFCKYISIYCDNCFYDYIISILTTHLFCYYRDDI